MHRKATGRPVGESPTRTPETGAKSGVNPHLGSQDAVIRRWFTHSARELPWRQPPAPGPHPGGWGVLVSEFMLQQTPVDRVLPLEGTARAHALQEASTVGRTGALAGKILVEPGAGRGHGHAGE